MTNMDKWLCLNKFCSICTNYSCKKHKVCFKSKKAIELWIAISLKYAEIDIALDRHDKKRVERLSKELKNLRKTIDSL